MASSSGGRTSGLSYVPELDGLRAIACLGVLIAHYNPIVTHHSFVLQLVRDSSSGNIGVVLFFTLSGYLIMGLALRQWRNRLGFDFSRFILRRALRIWPIYYFYVAISRWIYYYVIVMRRTQRAVTLAHIVFGLRRCGS
jgi:peptidoglycan/LPS O-acetylase OafA/YrhL